MDPHTQNRIHDFLAEHLTRIARPELLPDLEDIVVNALDQEITPDAFADGVLEVAQFGPRSS